jgi:cellulose synthase/poly-beta-1,6-N-acetylglucosamine synthase-like glycosyltransferase
VTDLQSVILTAVLQRRAPCHTDSRVAAILFSCGVAFIAYVLFGYPLLLLALGWLRSKPLVRAPIRPSVSVLIPVRDGERWIEEKLRSVFSLNYPPELMEVIVVSDGSRDRTADLARQFPVRLLELPAGGKCAALNTAMAAATGEILFFTDVRQPLDPDCLANLVACFADPKVGVASGELVLISGDRREHASIGLYVRYEEWLRKQISKVASVPGATGAVYAIRRQLAVPLPEEILLDDVYQPLAAYFQGYRVILEGSAIAYDYPTLMGTEFRRKVRTLAGIYQIIRRFPQLWNPRHDIWLHFLSHKFARLILPYAFLLVGVTSHWLPRPWAVLALSAQWAFYGLALADFLIPESWFIKRLSSLCRTFLTLLAASAAAVSILFRPSNTLWTPRR